MLAVAILALGGCKDRVKDENEPLYDDVIVYRPSDTSSQPQTDSSNINSNVVSSEITSSEITSSEIVSSETVAPKPQVPAWKKAYTKYIKECEEYVEFRLIYLDGDDIPELYCAADYEAAGSAVCTYYNGSVKEHYLRRLRGDSYIERSGLIQNFNGNMGYYSCMVFKLEKGEFKTLFSGEEEHEYYYDEEQDLYLEEISYYIEGETVTEEEFESARGEVFDYSKSEIAAGYDDMLDRKAILREINNW